MCVAALCGVCAPSELCPARMCSRVRKFDDQNFPPRAILGSLDRFSIMHANNKKEQSTNKRRVEARRGYTPMRQSTAPQARERVTLSHNTVHGTRDRPGKELPSRTTLCTGRARHKKRKKKATFSCHSASAGAQPSRLASLRSVLGAGAATTAATTSCTTVAQPSRLRHRV